VSYRMAPLLVTLNDPKGHFYYLKAFYIPDLVFIIHDMFTHE